MLVSVSPPRGPNASQTYVVQPAAHHPQEVHDARDGSAKQVLPDHSTTVAAARLNSLAPAFPPLPSISALPVRINLRTMANLVLVVCVAPLSGPKCDVASALSTLPGGGRGGPPHGTRSWLCSYPPSVLTSECPECQSVHGQPRWAMAKGHNLGRKAGVGAAEGNSIARPGSIATATLTLFYTASFFFFFFPLPGGPLYVGREKQTLLEE